MTELKKAMHRAIMKAYLKGKSVSKEHAVSHIIKDLEDPNNVAEVPKDHIPATASGVLQKELKPGQAVGELHNQKQMNAEAKMGKIPKQAAQMPEKRMATPGEMNSVSGIKPPRPLKTFMSKMEKKRGGGEKGVHSPEASSHFFDKEGKRDLGVSVAGAKARAGEEIPKFDDKSGFDSAKEIHKEKLEELKSIKPKLTKSKK